MAIGTAVQKGSMVHVYDEKGRPMGLVPLGGGQLQGYTGSTISVRKGNMIHTYDEKGKPLGMVSAR